MKVKVILSTEVTVEFDENSAKSLQTLENFELFTSEKGYPALCEAIAHSVCNQDYSPPGIGPILVNNGGDVDYSSYPVKSVTSQFKVTANIDAERNVKFQVYSEILK